MDNDLFRRGEWLGTFTILFIFAMVIFFIACLLGFFVDPSLSMDTRQAIVAASVAIFLFVAFFTTLARHAN